jgi:hypothetical protein
VTAWKGKLAGLTLLAVGAGSCGPKMLPYREAYYEISDTLFLSHAKSCPQFHDVDMGIIERKEFETYCSAIPIDAYRRCLKVARELSCEDRLRWAEEGYPDTPCDKRVLCAWERGPAPTKPDPTKTQDQ